MLVLSRNAASSNLVRRDILQRSHDVRANKKTLNRSVGRVRFIPSAGLRFHFSPFYRHLHIVSSLAALRFFCPTALNERVEAAYPD